MNEPVGWTYSSWIHWEPLLENPKSYLIWVNCDFQAEKRSLYVDMRDDGEEDNMANWDEEKLKEVVAKKHAEEKSQPNTDIVS